MTDKSLPQQDNSHFSAAYEEQILGMIAEIILDYLLENKEIE